MLYPLSYGGIKWGERRDSNPLGTGSQPVAATALASFTVPLRGVEPRTPRKSGECSTAELEGRGYVKFRAHSLHVIVTCKVNFKHPNLVWLVRFERTFSSSRTRRITKFSHSQISGVPRDIVG